MAALFTLRVFATNLLRGSRRRNIFHISFLLTNLGYEPRLLRLIKPTHYILDHGDFITDRKMQVIDQKHACHLLKNASHPPKNTNHRQDIGDIDD